MDQYPCPSLSLAFSRENSICKKERGGAGEESYPEERAKDEFEFGL